MLLPPAPAEGGRQLEEAGAPAGPAEAEDTGRQLALLKCLTAGSGVGLPRPQPLPLPHPRFDSPAGTAVALAALVQLDAGGSSGGAGSSRGGRAAGGGSAARLLAKPQLESLLQPDGPPPSLQQLTALLLLARFWLRQSDGRQAWRALAALQAAPRSGGGGSQVPSAGDLHAVRCTFGLSRACQSLAA